MMRPNQAIAILSTITALGWTVPAIAGVNTVQWFQRPFQGTAALCKAQSAQALRQTKLQNIKTETLQVSGETKETMVVVVCNDLPTGTVQTLIFSGKNAQEIERLSNTVKRALP